MQIGKTGQEIGFIELDHKKQKIEKIDFINQSMMSVTFPGIDGGNYNYLKLQTIMRDFTKNYDMSLENISKEIEREGFIFGLNPSLYIKVQNTN